MCQARCWGSLRRRARMYLTLTFLAFGKPHKQRPAACEVSWCRGPSQDASPRSGVWSVPAGKVLTVLGARTGFVAQQWLLCSLRSPECVCVCVSSD